MGIQIDPLAAQGEKIIRPTARGKPAALVELAVAGDMNFGNQPQNFAPVNHRRAVVQPAVPPVPHRQAQGGEHVQLCRLLQNAAQGVLRPTEEGLLQKQVPAGVAGDAQLGQGQHLYPLGRRRLHQSDDLPRVVVTVRDLDPRRARRHLYKTVPHGWDPLQCLIPSSYPNPAPNARKKGALSPRFCSVHGNVRLLGDFWGLLRGTSCRARALPLPNQIPPF